jgi:formate dehydrogenase
VARVLCVLYDDPVASRPGGDARGAIPNIGLYPDGQTLPSPATVDFLPGELLGDLSGRLGLAQFLAERGHPLTATSQHDGPDSVFERALPEAEIVISQGCWPACLPAERIAKAHNLKLVITAGVGSDHIDLEAAAKRGITVAEITYSSSVSAAEYAVMLILSLVHNVSPAPDQSARRDRKIADYASRAYDLEGMRVGSVGAGRAGFAVLRRLRPFDVRLHYTDPRRLPLAVENQFGLTYHSSTPAMLPSCDVVTIHSPLNTGTARLFDADMIARMKRGAYLINTARGGICDPVAVADGLKTGRLAGYAADIDGQPFPAAVAVHIAGASLSAQARYAAGTREVLECWFDGVPIRDDYLIVDRGNLTRLGKLSYGGVAGR